jgi:hypothetical protein
VLEVEKANYPIERMYNLLEVSRSACCNGSLIAMPDQSRRNGAAPT